jgi:hypothetical protein
VELEEAERKEKARRGTLSVPHPANLARACWIGDAKAEACLTAELGLCSNTSAPSVALLRKIVEATRVELEEAERKEIARCDGLSDGHQASEHTLCGMKNAITSDEEGV